MKQRYLVALVLDVDSKGAGMFSGVVIAELVHKAVQEYQTQIGPSRYGELNYIDVVAATAGPMSS